MTTIRNARNYDASALAELCGELGYRATRQQIVARLAAIEATKSACVLVAEDAHGRVVGWLHVAQLMQLTSDADAEILGLVVAESVRGTGVGTALLDAVDAWAQTRGATQVRVRSRVERERAHRFYERAGFVKLKTQAVFRKPLD